MLVNDVDRGVEAAQNGKPASVPVTGHSEDDPIAADETAADVNGQQQVGVPPVARLGRNVLSHAIGYGGMGTVYEALDTHTQEKVALKLIRVDAVDSRDAQRFEREIEATKALDHPDIVKVVDSGTSGPYAWYTMPLIVGTDLEKWCAHRGVEAVARIVARIARAVHYAHEQGFLHRDLKPSNVIVQEDGTPIITDFGLARNVVGSSSLTNSDQAIGTPGYMSPEQASGQHDSCTAATDVWSIGVILYEIIVGSEPFPGTNALDIMQAIYTRDPIPPRRYNHRISHDMENVIMQCMERRQRDRYRSAALLADDLERIAAGQPARARSFGLRWRALRGMRRNWGKVTAVMLGTLATTLVAWFIWSTLAARTGRWSEAFSWSYTEPIPASFTFLDDMMFAEQKPWMLCSDGLIMQRSQWLQLADVSVAGDVRVEAEILFRSYVDGFELTIASDIAPHANSQHVPVGYSCQVGGYVGRMDLISCNRQPMTASTMDSRPTRIMQDVVHTVVFERSGDRISVSYDDGEALSRTYPMPLSGDELDGIALRCMAANTCLRSVRVYELATPPAPDALSSGDIMARLGHHEKAYREYKLLSETYSDLPLGELAAIKGFLVGLGLGKPVADVFGPALAASDNPQAQRALDSVALNSWRVGAIDTALDQMEEAFVRYPETDIPLRCIAASIPRELSDAQGQRLLTLVSKVRNVTELSLFRLPIRDISPLAGMDLRSLDIAKTKVSDLTPVGTMRNLQHLFISGTPITDLDPLRGLPLTELQCGDCGVASLEPLRECPLRILKMNRSQVADLEPLRGLPLEEFSCSQTDVLSLEALVNCPLRYLQATNLSITRIPDFTRAQLEWVQLSQNQLTDLSPLRGHPLQFVALEGNQIIDISALAGAPIEWLSLNQNPITGLSALSSMPLTSLALAGTGVAAVPPMPKAELYWLNLGGNGMTEVPAILENHRGDVDLVGNCFRDVDDLVALPRVGLGDVPEYRLPEATLMALVSQHPDHWFAREAQILIAFHQRDRDTLEALAQSNASRALFIPYFVERDQAHAIAETLGGQLWKPASQAAVIAAARSLTVQRPGWVDVTMSDPRWADGSRMAEDDILSPRHGGAVVTSESGLRVRREDSVTGFWLEFVPSE